MGIRRCRLGSAGRTRIGDDLGTALPLVSTFQFFSFTFLSLESIHIFSSILVDSYFHSILVDSHDMSFHIFCMRSIGSA